MRKICSVVVAVLLFIVPMEALFKKSDADNLFISEKNTDISAAASQNNVIVGYYAGWAAYRGYTPDKIPAHKLSQINYAFAKIDKNTYKITLADPATDKKNFAALRTLKNAYPDLRILISVGGWDYSDQFSITASTKENREVFAQSCADFISEHRLDGIDLDWEYPVSGGLSGNGNRPEDKENFTLLLAAVREKLDALEKKDGRKYDLTIAGAASRDYLKKIEPGKVAALVDHIFIMAYDMHGPWDDYADLNAPLYMPKEDSPQYKNSVYDGIQSYLESGVPADKLVMGIPLYGYIYTGVSGQNNGLYSAWQSAKAITYTAIAENYLSNAAYAKLYHAQAKVPYLYGNNTFISYDDAASVAKKAELANELGLAGVGFWELSQDSKEVLIESAYNTLAGLWVNPFFDVQTTDWYYVAVRFVSENGLMAGISPTTFSPNTPITRGMFATLLHRLEGTPKVNQSAPFADVSKEAYYADAVAWAYQNEILHGHENNLFAPDTPITREQAAAVLFRYAEYKGYDTKKTADLSAFSDAASISPYALSAMQWASATGLISGRTETRLEPAQTTSRAEAAALFMRFTLMTK